MSKSKNKKKSSQMVLRVEKHEKDQFQDICKGLDTSAARELRRFMREFVAAHSAAAAQPAPEAADTGVDTADLTATEPAVAETAEADSVPAGDADEKAKKKVKKK